MTRYTYRSWKTLNQILKAMWSSMQITHAVPFEANAGNYDSKETFVETLAWQPLYFTR